MQKLYITLLAVVYLTTATAQNIWDFTSVQPAEQVDQLVFPEGTHAFQYLIEEGGTDVNEIVVPGNFDFTGFVPIDASKQNNITVSSNSTEGYLSINNELTTGSVTMCDVKLNGETNLWELTQPTVMDFSEVGGTNRNCSGGVTPWGTVLTAEENFSPTLQPSGHLTIGWIVEIDPPTRTVLGKRHHIGNFSHENAAIHPLSNNRVVYSGYDSGNGFVVKMIANDPMDLSSGELYVMSVEPGATTGSWVRLANLTAVDQNSTIVQVEALGINPFDGVEDIEVGADGWVYFTAKGDRATYRFKEKDNDPFALELEQFEVYVGSETAFNGGATTTKEYTIDFGTGTGVVDWGANDNLTIDNDNNLWVLMDGGGENEIFMVEEGHTQENPKVKLFAISPAGSEPTGMTFTPDNKYMFLSIQHPSSENQANQRDASGVERNFDKDVAIVIALDENLGLSNNALSVQLTNWEGRLNQDVVDLNWVTASERESSHFIVQRQGANGWNNLYQIDAKGNSQSKQRYTFTDNKPQVGINYYRLLQVDRDGKALPSNIIIINYAPLDNAITLTPNVVSDVVNVQFAQPLTKEMGIIVMNNQGQMLHHQQLITNAQQAQVDVSTFAPGIYWLSTDTGQSRKFVIVR